MEIQNLKPEDLIIRSDGDTILILGVKRVDVLIIVHGLWSHDAPLAGPRASWGVLCDSICHHFRAERVIRDGEVYVILDENGNDITAWRLALDKYQKEVNGEST